MEEEKEKEEVISKCRVLFLANFMLYEIVTIIVLSIVIDKGEPLWIFLLAYGLSLIFWMVAALFAYGFFKEEQQGKNTRYGSSAETAFIRLIIQIFFIPARKIGERRIKIATAVTDLQKSK